MPITFTFLFLRRRTSSCKIGNVAYSNMFTFSYWNSYRLLTRVHLKCTIWISCLGVATLSNSAVMACQSSFFFFYCVPHYFSLALCLSGSQPLCPNFLMGCCFREPPWPCVTCGTRKGSEESCVLQRVTHKLLWSLLPVMPLQERGEEWTAKIRSLRTFSISFSPAGYTSPAEVW